MGARLLEPPLDDDEPPPVEDEELDDDEDDEDDEVVQPVAAPAETMTVAAMNAGTKDRDTMLPPSGWPGGQSPGRALPGLS